MPITNERKETIRVAKKLNKFIALPSMLNWKVHESDVLRRGRVLCMIRSKNFFFPDDISSLKMRMATVTKHGYLVLYESVDEGLVIDLRSATHILTECDKYKSERIKYSRSHVKVRLPRGNVHMFLRDDDISKWTAALLEAHVSFRPTAAARVVAKPRQQPSKNVETMTAIEPVEVMDSPTSPVTSSNSGLITVLERGVSSEDTLIPSVRRGVIPVNTLRYQIEKHLEMCTPASEQLSKSSDPNISSMYVFHQGIQVKQEPIDDDQEEEQQVQKQLVFKIEGSEDEEAVKKEWWLRSLRC
ncbi:DUF7778 domain-containing protein [Caenorhabditis elegans]|uniref:PH domain-containing protein n=1 Tax=Caenorhabditis elegans TaxID=6239 RepID=Q21871_CAEEL|nr:PH domain-containing protein [Caenorhabditis elegans]CAA94297.1 PH domain-containing protein [Caenorhabditis elegans]|eukprot:NP_501889.1 Uncharacterized protein CELE_R09E10.6 [Caenorhabditis elegans]